MRFIIAAFLALLLSAKANSTCTPPQWSFNRTSTLVQYIAVFSPTANANITYGIYLPPEYSSTTTRRFPVLYWLHGGASNASGGEGFVSRASSAMARGVMPPAIIILPNGPGMFWTDSNPGLTPYDAPIESVIVNDLIPLIDSTYRTVATREGRGIEGFSMGGRGSTRLGLKFAADFGLVSNLAGAVQTLEFFQTANRAGDIYECVFDSDSVYFDANSPQTHAVDAADYIHLAGLSFRFIVGGNDGGNLRANQTFAALLDSLAIPYTFTIVPNVGHCYQCLYDVLGDAAFQFFADAWGQ